MLDFSGISDEKIEIDFILYLSVIYMMNKIIFSFQNNPKTNDNTNSVYLESGLGTTFGSQDFNGHNTGFISNFEVIT